MLADKAKEKFKEWLFRNQEYRANNDRFQFLPLVCQQALIVDWLDSEGIYVLPCINFGFGYEIYEDGTIISPIEVGVDFKNRPEALTKAIEKANTLINLK